MNKFMRIVSAVTLLVFLRVNFALAAEQVYFYYTDPAGTPLAMSDSGGAVVWRAEYQPFGEGDTPSPLNNKAFVGKEIDSESGLHYFGARYMDSPAGRFVAPDPIGAVDPYTEQINQLILHDPQRLNLYAYGLNNPYRFVDPDGKIAIADDVIFWSLVGLTALVLTARHGALMNQGQHQKQVSNVMNSQDNSSTSVSANNQETTANNLPPEQNKRQNKNAKKKAKSSKKERSTERPSWAEGEKPQPGESGKDFAKRLMDKRYGVGEYDKGPSSEFNKLKKFGDRFNK